MMKMGEFKRLSLIRRIELFELNFAKHSKRLVSQDFS